MRALKKLFGGVRKKSSRAPLTIRGANTSTRHALVNEQRPESKRLKGAAEIGRAFEEYRGELQSFLARRSRRAQVSDDLMQDIYVELLRFSPREAVREPQAYLYKIAWRVLNRFNVRAQHEAVPHEPQYLLRMADRLADRERDQPLSELEAEQRILSVLSELPPLYGQALILSRRDGLSYSEIGRRLNISVHTVRKYLTRAVAHLKNASRDE